LCETETEEGYQAIPAGLDSRDGVITDGVFVRVSAPTYVELLARIEGRLPEP
jgi:hypothetical protein